MNETIEKAEQLLADKFSRKHCVLAGRATSAIWLALRALGHESGKVIVPTIMCPNPANAVLYANLKPIFCDVNEKDFNIDETALTQLFDKHNNIRAIIVVHLYGHPAPMKKIIEIAQKKGVPVIEDVAQALGATINEQPLGSFGDVSILSFGSNKIPGLAGGGALLTDDDELAEAARSSLTELPEKPDDAEEMQAAYQTLYYAVRDLDDYTIDTVPFYRCFPEAFKRMYLYKLEEQKAQAIIDGIGTLEDNVATRREKAKIYKEELVHPKIRHPVVNYNEAAFWRYSIIYEGDAQAIAEKIRELDIDASNWYPNISSWYDCTDKHPGATFVEKHIINLWTDETKSVKEIQKDCKKIVKLVREQK